MKRGARHRAGALAGIVALPLTYAGNGVLCDANGAEAVYLFLGNAVTLENVDKVGPELARVVNQTIKAG